jgi:hypothetical protein
MPGQDREVAAATDGELLAWRAAYGREVAWAPPYVAGELRGAHIAEDAYRADAVQAWWRADAAAGEAERVQARLEAEAFSALAQEVGARREAMAEVAEARRAWHEATEVVRQRALVADTELRRRHPGIDLTPLHPDEELTAEVDQQETREAGSGVPEATAMSLDIEAAVEAARQAQQIIADREQQADRDAELESDDLMRRREAEAVREADARRSAVRQEPMPSRRAEISGRQPDFEMEAG